MFKFGKKEKEESQERKVYGFLCTTGLKRTVKLMARKSQVPDYCVAEHCLQMDIAQTGIMFQHELSAKELREYLIRDHLLKPAVPENPYDFLMTQKALTQQIEHMQREQAVHFLVGMLEQRGITPKRFVKIVAEILRYTDKQKQPPVNKLIHEEGEGLQAGVAKWPPQRLRRAILPEV